MPGRQMKEFAASHRVLQPEYRRLRDANQEDRLELSIYFKPHTHVDASALPAEARARRDAIRDRRVAEHENDVLLLREFAEQHGLQVTSEETERRLVKVAGTVAQLQRAFLVQLGVYTDGKREVRSYEGRLSLPENMVDSIESVLGLDNHPIAQPHIVVKAAGAVSPADQTGHLPNAVGALYNFPTNVNGAGQCIGIIELGGGYYPSDNTTAFQQMGLNAPTVVAVSVDGGTNSPGVDPNADGEVALDIQVAGGNAPGAKLAVYFAPNTIQGFADAITQAANDATNSPSVLSISWGTAEVNWAAGGTQAMQTMNTALQDADTLLVATFVADGDNWATDGVSNGKANVNFPASSPYAFGCGGTTINTSGNSITSETVWNNSSSGTGGGVSDYFAVPTFQQGVTIPTGYNGNTGRGVPDVAADADPNSGYTIVLNGSSAQYGGTSAVAPLWAGLTALINQAASQAGAPRVGFFTPQIYMNRQSFREILQGNNIAPSTNIGYNAGPTWNPCSGLGVPDGAALMTMLAKQAAASTKIGGVQWTQEPQLRIYYQGANNAILENCWMGAWTPGAVLPMAAQGSAIAAVDWGDINIRVYYQDAGNALREYCFSDGGWGAGAMMVPTAAAGSALAATAWGSVSIRVYYQDTGNVIRENCWDGNGWSAGSMTLSDARAGSTLAAVSWGDISIRVYYQDANNVIRENCYDGNGWYAGTLVIADAQPGSAIAAVDWIGPHLRVYYQDVTNAVREQCWDGNGWTAGATLPMAVAGTPLNALQWIDASGQMQLRVYYEANGAINEAMYSSAGWGTGGAYIPVAVGAGVHASV